MYNAYLHRVALLVFALGLFYFSGGQVAHAAISYDNSSLANGDSISTKTVSYAAGSNVDIVVGCEVPATFSVDSVTFDGNPLDLVSTQTLAGATFSNLYFFNTNGVSGTHDVVITASGSTFLYCAISSYAGVGGVDTHSEGSSITTTLSTAVSTSIDNDWLVFFAGRLSSADTFSAGANTVIRQIEPSEWFAIGDSSSDQTPAGSHNQTVVFNTSGASGMNVIALYPTGATPPTPAPSGGNGLSNCVLNASGTACAIQVINNPNQDFFMGIFAFFAMFYGMIWLFRKKK